MSQRDNNTDPEPVANPMREASWAPDYWVGLPPDPGDNMNAAVYPQGPAPSQGSLTPATGLTADVIGQSHQRSRAFGITDAPAPDLSAWEDVTDRQFNPEGEVTIAVVGKYVGLQDAYKSLNEALVHGGLANRAKVHVRWLDAEMFEHDDADLAAFGNNAPRVSASGSAANAAARQASQRQRT